MNFSNLTFPKLDLTGVVFDKFALFKDCKIERGPRETFRIIKNEFMRTNNRIDALEFHMGAFGIVDDPTLLGMGTAQQYYDAEDNRQLLHHASPSLTGYVLYVKVSNHIVRIEFHHSSLPVTTTSAMYRAVVPSNWIFTVRPEMPPTTSVTEGFGQLF